MSTLSQITTSLENDRSAIRNAILSGGGTCPEGHGFDDFASDIGSIPTGVEEITGSISITPAYDDKYWTSGTVKQFGKYVYVSTVLINQSGGRRTISSGSKLFYIKNLELTGLTFYRAWYSSKNYESQCGTYGDCILASTVGDVTNNSFTISTDAQRIMFEDDQLYLPILFEFKT